MSMKLRKAKHGYLVGYGVSAHAAALTKAGVLPDNLHIEKASGASSRRPALDLAIKDLRPGDTFLVWNVGCLARSTQQLLKRLYEIYAAGASFKSLTESFDFGNAPHKLVLRMLGLCVELGRQLTDTRSATEARIAR